MVQLLGDNGSIVGVGVVDTSFTCGSELHQVKLRPIEIVVHVTHALDETKWIGEVVGKFMGDCVDKVIQWSRASVCWAHPSEVRMTSTSPREGQNFSSFLVRAPEFDFHDIEENPSIFGPTPPSHGERSVPKGSSPMTQGSVGNTLDVTRMEGMPMHIPRRRYSMANRRTRVKSLRERGESASQKVTLDSVLCAKEKGACKHNCLREVEAKYVLDQRYMAWGQKYKTWATWIMQMLNAIYTRTESPTRDKYVTKLDGRVVCNAYYVVALGYS